MSCPWSWFGTIRRDGRSTDLVRNRRHEFVRSFFHSKDPRRDVRRLDAGNGLAEVVLVDPRGRQDVVPVSVKQIGPGRFRCEYVPREPGLHSVNVFFAGRPIPSSPYGVNVASCK